MSIQEETPLLRGPSERNTITTCLLFTNYRQLMPPAICTKKKYRNKKDADYRFYTFGLVVKENLQKLFNFVN